MEEQQLHVVSYLPVNAFLVKGSDESVERLALDADIASVSPWHPAFKLEPELLTQVIDGRPLEASLSEKPLAARGSHSASLNALPGFTM